MHDSPKSGESEVKKDLKEIDWVREKWANLFHDMDQPRDFVIAEMNFQIP
jgi:hypothetical protein